MSRLLAAALLVWCGLTFPAAAACEGENLIENLPQDTRSTLQEAVARAPYPQGNFWRATRSGSTVHVLGTLHTPDPRHGSIVAQVQDIVRAADLVILEVTQDTEAELQNIMVDRPDVAIITEGPTLIDLMGDEDWALVADALTERGIPPFMGAKFQPWLVMMILSLPSCAMEDIASGKPGLDAQIEALANSADVPLAELDEVDGLLEVLNSGTPEEQVEMLRVTVTTDFDREALQATLEDSYFAGRHRELWEFNRLLVDQMADPAVFRQLEANLLDARNAAWEAKLPDLLAGSDTVIAVGAAHLSGETGVLRALERMGYSLTRIPLDIELAR